MPEARRPHRGGLWLVASLAVVAVVGPRLAPYDPNQQLDPASGRWRPPGTVFAAVALGEDRWLLADHVERTAEGLRVERLGRTEVYPAAAVQNLTATGVADRRVFTLGSDGFGRDVFSRLLHGARVSLWVASLAVALSLLLGITLGAVAGFAGGVVDSLLMRAVDAFLAFPSLFLVILLAAIFRPGTALVVVVLAATSWMSTARLVRGEIRSLSERDFVLAARGMGLSPARILWHHLLPNALTPVIVQGSLLVGQLILMESSLSFFGLGVQPPAASWGNMVADGRDALQQAWWVSVFPGLALMLTAGSFHWLGDHLHERLNPRHTPSG